MSTRFLFFGLGFVAYPVFIIASTLIGARLHDRHLRMDEIKTGWWE